METQSSDRALKHRGILAQVYMAGWAIFLSSSFLFSSKLIVKQELSLPVIDYGAWTNKIIPFLQTALLAPLLLALVWMVIILVLMLASRFLSKSKWNGVVWLVFLGLSSFLALTPLINRLIVWTPVTVVVMTPIVIIISVGFATRNSNCESWNLCGGVVGAYLAYKSAGLVTSSGIGAAFPVSWSYVKDEPMVAVYFVAGLAFAYLLGFLLGRPLLKPLKSTSILTIAYMAFLVAVSVWLIFTLDKMLERLMAFPALDHFRGALEILAIVSLAIVIRRLLEHLQTPKLVAGAGGVAVVVLAVSVLLTPIPAKATFYNPDIELNAFTRILLSTSFDRDSDRASVLLGQNDCNDNNFAVRPGRSDIPLNGIDENCLAGDLKIPDPPKPVWTLVGGQKPRKIILAVVDTLRSDMVFSSKPEMKHLAEFAKKHAGFSRAYSHGPVTGVSMFNMFYPERVTPNNVVRKKSLFKPYLQDAGYTSACFKGSYREASQLMTYLLAKRCDKLDIASGKKYNLVSYGGDVTRRAVEYLRKAPDSTFVWLLLDDVHDYLEYRSGAGYKVRYFFDSLPHVFSPATMGKHLKENYVNRVQYIDNVLYKNLLVPLDTDPELKDTLLILLGDHGEEFFEHGGMFHGETLYDEVLHIPVVLKDGMGGGVQDKPVAISDATRLIMQAIGYTREPGPAVTLRSTSDPDRILYHFMPSTGDFAIRQGRYKTIMNYVTNAQMLFDLKKDPGETHDISYEQPEIAAKFRKLMDWQSRLLIKK